MILVTVLEVPKSASLTETSADDESDKTNKLAGFYRYVSVKGNSSASVTNQIPMHYAVAMQEGHCLCTIQRNL